MDKDFELPCPTCGKMRKYSSRAALWLAASKVSECRSCAVLKYSNSINTRCERLLDGSLEAYYWIGFILADGHIDNRKRLVVTLAIKDHEHLVKLGDFLSTKVRARGESLLSVMDTNVFERLSEKFDIKSNKTYFPPDKEVFKKLSKPSLTALFAGFIDGDGCLQTRCSGGSYTLIIKEHGSWLYILELFSEFFFGNARVYINKEGYSVLSCTNTPEIKNLKKEVIKLNLPILKRKWDKININMRNQYNISTERIELAKKEAKNCSSIQDMAGKLNISYGGARKIIIKNNIQIG